MTASASALELHDLAPEPAAAWQRLLRFVNLQAAERRAMIQTAESLLGAAPQLVIDTYDYLLSVPETAAVLGWENGADPAHLAERRRFFTIWLARTIGLDTSDEFAYYLFRAGKFHAGHGPRRIHVPAAYVTGSIGLVQAAFVRASHEAGLPGDVVAAASAGWNKYLNAQLHLMLSGYQAARDLDRGQWPVTLTFFGRMRALVGTRRMTAHIDAAATTADLLRKFFNYHPQTRTAALECVWQAPDETDSLWLEPVPVYKPQWGWRVLHNGRDLAYAGGFTASLAANDTIAISPPGR